MLRIEPGREPTPPIDAATVMLLRERAGAGGLEVFMVRRHTKSGFMGGAYVFPGGKLDAADASPEVLARCVGRSEADAARALGEPDAEERALPLYVAALRETFEEAGVLLADVDAPADLERARARAAAGEPFAGILATLAAKLRVDAMVPWARWVTPVVEPRRYDTRFFVVVSPPDQTAAPDRRETTEARWLAPREALDLGEAGEIQLPPPTVRNLELLDAIGSAAEVVARARARVPAFVDPVFVDEDGRFVLALPGDVHHPTRERAVDGPTRFVLDGGRWISGPGE